MRLALLLYTGLSASAEEIRKPHPDAFCDGRSICQYKGNVWRCTQRNIEGDCIQMERVILSSIATPKAEKSVSKPPSDMREKPMLCVFDKNRSWNPERIVFNDAIWECAEYGDDGVCLRVQKVKDIINE